MMKKKETDSKPVDDIQTILQRARARKTWHYGLLDGYRSTQAWHDDDPTDKQLKRLKVIGYKLPEGVTKGEAAWLCGRPTPYQKRSLEQSGHWEDELTFSEAQAILQQLCSRKEPSE
jgi:hypothetical protein